MTAPFSSEADADPARLSQSLRECRLELAELRRAQEVREELLAPLELAQRQLESVTRVLDRHLTGAEQEATPRRRTFFGRSSDPDPAAPTAAEAGDLARLRACPLFDGPWYLRQYPKTIRTGLSPALHYLRLGGEQRNDPGPHFSVSAYLRDHPDLPQGTNHLLHYLDSVPSVTT